MNREQVKIDMPVIYWSNQKEGDERGNPVVGTIVTKEQDECVFIDSIAKAVNIKYLDPLTEGVVMTAFKKGLSDKDKVRAHQLIFYAKAESFKPEDTSKEDHFYAFANLVEPLKSKLSPEDWEFLLTRGKKFIYQILK